MEEFLKRFIALLIGVGCIISFYSLLTIDLSTTLSIFGMSITITTSNSIIKFFLCILLLAGTGIALQKLLNLEGSWGLIFIRKKEGLEIVDRIANISPELWKGIADFGMVLGFGVASIWMTKIPKRIFLFSFLVLFLLTVFILPSVLPIALSVIAFPINIYTEAQANIQAVSEPSSLLNLFQFGILLLILVGGLCTAGVAALLLKGVHIIISIIKSAMGDTTALDTTAPGAAFILPGINIPLFEGIVAIIVLILAHELGHGVLARIGQIKLNSAGLVFFGIFPIGAFMDPEEEELRKASAEKQNKVLVAGSTANFIVAIFSFFALFIFSFLTTNMYDEKIEIAGIYRKEIEGNVSIGMKIEEINGRKVGGIESFRTLANWSANESVVLLTNKGPITLKTDENGRLGIIVRESYLPGYWWLESVYKCIALIFILNFLVGSVNLLPLPLFDGYRIIELVVDKRAIRYISAVVFVLFLINFLPWMWL